MISPAFPHRLLNLRQRLAALAAALTVTASIASALLMTFHGASPVLWLAPTPELLAMVNACAQQPTRDQRERCRQQRVAEHIAQRQQPLQLARR